MKCGVYAFMAAALTSYGYVLLGSGIVNEKDDRWILFQQTSGPLPHLFVILIYVNAPYQGLAQGSACEIIVGRDWIREDT